MDWSALFNRIHGVVGGRAFLLALAFGVAVWLIWTLFSLQRELTRLRSEIRRLKNQTGEGEGADTGSGSKLDEDISPAGSMEEVDRIPAPVPKGEARDSLPRWSESDDTPPGSEKPLRQAADEAQLPVNEERLAEIDFDAVLGPLDEAQDSEDEEPTLPRSTEPRRRGT